MQCVEGGSVLHSPSCLSTVLSTCVRLVSDAEDYAEPHKQQRGLRLQEAFLCRHGKEAGVQKDFHEVMRAGDEVDGTARRLAVELPARRPVAAPPEAHQLVGGDGLLHELTTNGGDRHPASTVKKTPRPTRPVCPNGARPPAAAGKHRLIKRCAGTGTALSRHRPRRLVAAKLTARRPRPGRGACTAGVGHSVRRASLPSRGRNPPFLALRAFPSDDCVTMGKRHNICGGNPPPSRGASALRNATRRLKRPHGQVRPAAPPHRLLVASCCLSATPIADPPPTSARPPHRRLLPPLLPPPQTSPPRLHLPATRAD